MSTVQRTRQRFVEGNLEYALNERRRPGGRKKLDEKGEVVLIALAAEKAGTTTDSAAIRDALRDVANPPGEIVGPGIEGIWNAMELIRQGKDINYEGAGGSQDFNEKGDVISTIGIWKITGGEIVSTGRYELP